MKVNIPEDIIKELEKIKKKKRISIKKLIVEACMQYLVLEKSCEEND